MSIALCLILTTGRVRPLIRQLNDHRALMTGLAAGVPVYVAAVYLVRGSTAAIVDWAGALHHSLGPARPCARRALELGGRALYEEAFWRGTVQPGLGNGPLGITAAGVLFTLRHAYLSWLNDRPLRPRLFAELLLFSLVLGIVQARSNRLLCAVGIHWMRNLLIEARFPSLTPTAVMRMTAHAPVRLPR